MTYTLVREGRDLNRVAQCIVEAQVLGIDTETTSLDPREGQIRLFQVTDGELFYVVDAFQTNGLGPIVPALAESKAVKVIQNAKFEQKWFKYHFGIDLWPVFDTFRASAILYNGKDLGNNLYDILARELDAFPETDDLAASDWSGTLTQKQYDYAGGDIKELIPLRAVLKPKLAEAGLNTCAGIEFGAILPEAEAELNGIYLDVDAWTKLARENETRAAEIRKKLIRELPNPSDQLCFPGMEPPFNLDSNDQVLKSLQKLGLKRKIKTEDGKTHTVSLDTTTEIVLAQFLGTYPIIKDLFDYRECSKQVSSFGKEYLKHVNKVTGRVHTSYYPYTGAGRYASSKPNLQQIPNRGRGKLFRKCFKAPPGKKLVAADYSGVEMRIAADRAPDPILAAVFKKGLDAHTYTGSILNGIAYNEVTKVQRDQSKPVNFGLLYGMGAEKLVLYAMSQYGVVLTLRQAETFRHRYFEEYIGLKLWQQLAVKDGKRLGHTRTASGRIRYLPDSAYSEWMNTPVQGCLQSCVRILTQNGYIPIGDLYKADKGFEVWTGTNWAPAVVKDMGFWEAARVELEGGVRLECDTRHKVLVMAEDGYVWKSYEELQLGDKVCTSLCTAKEFSSPPPLPEIKHGEKSTLRPVRPEIDAQFWYWMGRYYGDGTLGKKCRHNLTYSFGDHEKEDVARCVAYWETFGVNPKVATRTHKPKHKVSTRHQVVIESVDLHRWLVSEVGLVPATAKTKRLPPRIYTETFENRKAFILGMMESDGHTPPQQGKPVPNLHLANEELLRDFLVLFRTVGVETRLRGPYYSDGKPSWRLDLFTQMYHALFKPQQYKPKAREMAPKFLCQAFADAYLKIARPPLGSSDYIMVRRLVRGGSVSLYTLQHLVDKCGIDIGPIYSFRRCLSKESTDIQVPTYTLSVFDPSHRYDSEGVISKNTGADSLKRALRNVLFRLRKEVGDKARIIHHVHDEILVEAEDDEGVINASVKCLVDGMTEALAEFMPSVPAEAVAKAGETWADVH